MNPGRDPPHAAPPILGDNDLAQRSYSAWLYGSIVFLEAWRSGSTTYIGRKLSEGGAVVESVTMVPDPAGTGIQTARIDSLLD